MIEIHPATHTAHRFAPLARILQHCPTAGLIKLILAEIANLRHARKLQLRLNQTLNRKPMTIPAKTARHLITLHRPVARHNILNRPREQMPVMRKARRKRRTIIKIKGRPALTAINGFLETLILIPQIQNALFHRRKRLISFDFTKHKNLEIYAAKNRKIKNSKSHETQAEAQTLSFRIFGKFRSKSRRKKYPREQNTSKPHAYSSLFFWAGPGQVPERALF